MDIQKEKDAFLNVFQFFKSFKGIGFSEETEQFFLKKNKPNDAECLDVSNLNQMWRAWWARAKSQAVPEGFLLVSSKELLDLTVAINAVDLATHTDNKTNEVREMWQDIAFRLIALGAQEQSHESD